MMDVFHVLSAEDQSFLGTIFYAKPLFALTAGQKRKGKVSVKIQKT
jgi:hypothetical protein